MQQICNRAELKASGHMTACILSSSQGGWQILPQRAKRVGQITQLRLADRFAYSSSSPGILKIRRYNFSPALETEIIA